MKKKRSFRLFSMILALAMMCGIMAEGFSAPPAAAAANNAGTSYAPVTTGDPTNMDGVTVEKSAQAVSSQEYNAGTENEFWVQFDVTGQDDTTEPKPVDVVMVLDASGSMKGDSRAGALKEAAKDFAKEVLEGNNVSPDNRVATIIFSDSIKNTWTTGFRSDYSGYNGVESVINSYVADGGTRQGLALEQAYDLLQRESSADRKKVVVLFTDGMPALYVMEYDWCVEAAEAAKQIQSLQNTELYCVYWEPDWDDTYAAGIDADNVEGTSSSSYSYADKYFQYDGIEYGRYGTVNDNGYETWANGYYFSKEAQKDFIHNDVLPSLADEGKLIEAAQSSEGLKEVFDDILGQVFAYATDLTIHDAIQTENFTFNASASGAVQYKYANQEAWTTMGTDSSADAYYVYDGNGGIDLKFTKVSSAQGALQVRFQVTLNSGKVSATDGSASFESPDLDTNASASISFTDANNAPQSGSIEQYPKVYIPSQTLTIQKVVEGTEDAFTFTTGVNHNNSDNWNKSASLKNGETVVYQNLRVGANYSVTEQLGGDSKYHLDSVTDAQGNPVAFSNNTVAGTIELGKDVTLVFTNKDKSDSLHLDKTAELVNWENRTYKIDLSAWADGQTTSIETRTPADIVLVLDNSGSMGDYEYVAVAETFAELQALTGNRYYYYDTSWWWPSYEGLDKNGSDWYKDDTRITESNFESEIGTVYQRLTRLEILREAVTEFVNALPDGSTITIETFADRASTICNTMKINGEASKQEVIGTLRSLRASGSTYMYRGLDLAYNALQSIESENKVVIAFTDGEDYNKERAKTSASNIKNTGAKLFTVGVGEANEEFLRQVCTQPQEGDDTEYFKNCENMDELADSLLEILEDTTTTGGFTNATVTDVIDPAFIVTDENGTPLENGASVAGGTLVIENGVQKIVWTAQDIPYDKDNPNQPTWSKTIYVKAKEEFIGGNDITTNGPESGISVDGIDKKFPQPEVNVKVRFDVTNDTDTIFKGEPIPGTTLVPYTTDSEGNIITGDDMYCGHTDIGTFTYSWNPVVEGTVDNTFPADKEYPEEDTQYQLTVTFTPQAADPNNTNNKVTTESKKEAEATTETGTYTVKVVPGELQITKTIDGEFYEGKGDIKQSFVFKVERYDSAEAYDNGSGTPTDTFNEVITVDASNAEQAKDGITKTVTGLSKGYYVVTEQEGDAWRYDQESMTDNWENNDGYVAIGTKTSEEPLAYYGVGENTAGVRENPATVGVTNKLTDEKWLSDTTVAVNTITNGSEA